MGKGIDKMKVTIKMIPDSEKHKYMHKPFEQLPFEPIIIEGYDNANKWIEEQRKNNKGYSFIFTLDW